MKFRKYVEAITKTLRYDLDDENAKLTPAEIGMAVLKHKDGIIPSQTAKQIVKQRVML